MSMHDLEAALALVAAHSTLADFHGPVPTSLILRAEDVLSLRFPPTYRRFLEALGCGDIAGAEIFGLTSHEDLTCAALPNAVGLTLAARRDAMLPSGLLLVYDLGDGGYYGLDTPPRTTTSSGEAPVVRWTPGMAEPPGILPAVAEDFGRLFLDLARDALADI